MIKTVAAHFQFNDGYGDVLHIVPEAGRLAGGTIYLLRAKPLFCWFIQAKQIDNVNGNVHDNC